MHVLQNIDYLLYRLLSDPLFFQLFPFLVLFLVPALVLTVHAHRHSLATLISMVLDTLSLALPWNWFDHHSAPSSLDKRKSRKKAGRVGQPQRDGEKHELAEYAGYDDGYYPGLVNISGTYCFMDSVMQAMASLTYLLPYIEDIYAKAVALDVSTPVVDALRDLLHVLNAPRSSPSSIRPHDIIQALSTASPGKHNSLFSSREHQDAQELFQLLSECLKNEAAAVEREGHRDRGLGGLARIEGPANIELGQSVFDGLTANRRSCMECGYTEAVMHFAFDNWQLSVPRLAGACRLEDCLDDYTRLELLTDCMCRKCSMAATYKKLAEDAEKLTQESGEADASSSKKKRAREARKLASRVKAAIDEGRLEEDIKGVKLEKVFSKASTKQAMIARPPRVLALHLNRSIHYGNYTGKNTCRVLFPEVLDLTPYTTSGQLSTAPSMPISTPPPLLPRSTTPTPASVHAPRTLYRLAAIVCHYGQHSFGHYVCFRRKPRAPSTGSRRFAPPALACPLACDCARCERRGPVRDDADEDETPGRGWLRISDDSVIEVGIESVLAEGGGAFMLFYDRVIVPRPSPYLSNSPRSSEETVRPAGKANGSTVSLASVDEEKEVVVHVPVPQKMLGPRIVRNVSAQARAMSKSPANGEARRSASPLVSKEKEELNGTANGHAVPNGRPPESNGVPIEAKAGSPTVYAGADADTPAPRPPSPIRPQSSQASEPTLAHAAARQPPPPVSVPPVRPPSPARTVGLRA